MFEPSFASLQPWRRLPGSGLTVATQKLHFKIQHCFRVNFATPFRKPPCQAETGRVRATTIQCSAELFLKKNFIYFPPHWGSDPGQQQQHQLQECSRRRQSQHWPHTPHQHMGTPSLVLHPLSAQWDCFSLLQHGSDLELQHWSSQEAGKTGKLTYV